MLRESMGVVCFFSCSSHPSHEIETRQRAYSKRIRQTSSFTGSSNNR